MDSRDQSGAASSVIRILRKATRSVQLAPFAYLFVYAAYMLAGPFVSERVVCLADSFLTISPIITIGFLAASGLFKLCVWHKVACLIPMSSQVENYIDTYIITFTQEEILIINAALGILSIVFIILASRHFIHGR